MHDKNESETFWVSECKNAILRTIYHMKDDALVINPLVLAII